MSILDNLKSDVDNVLTGTLQPATLWRRDYSSGPNDPDPVWTSYPCEGLKADFDAIYAALADFPITETKLEILASSLDTEPQAGDKIELGGAYWLVLSCAIDAARAMWSIHAGVTGAPS